MSNFLFTSESVALGHPDKIADQISDAILDACLKEDPEARVACEVLVTKNLVVLAGEITTKARPQYEPIARQVIRNAGYDRLDEEFNYQTCAILICINKQSPDIAQGVSKGTGKEEEQGAGDQGIMFGYACDETPQLMPLPILFAHQLTEELQRLRQKNELSYLRPDAKSQVTVEYNENMIPIRIDTIVISTQHSDTVSLETIRKDMISMSKRIAPSKFIDEETKFYVNPTGRFVIGGPAGDCGLTGRKTIVDTYGGMGRHGGGAFSGKDPSKVDRSASYAARYVAKNIVAAKLAKRCEVQLSYAIGIAIPTSIRVDTFGTANGVTEEMLEKIIPSVFKLSPKGIIDMLDLKRPIYLATASGGHFGHEQKNFSWERTDKVQALEKALEKHHAIKH